MRRPGLWLTALLLAAGLGAAWFLIRPALASPRVLPERMAWAAEADPSVAFVLEASRHLEYSVPDGAGQIRLLINANLRPQILEEGLSGEERRRQRPFRVALEELDTRGRSLKQQTWNLLAQVDVLRDPEQGGLRTALFFLDRDWVPSSTCEIEVDTRSPSRTRTLRIHFLGADPAIYDLVVRVYSPSVGSEAHQAHGWERLGDPIRTQLNSGNVYPYGLLRDQEKRNLLARLWKPLAPNSSSGTRPVQRQIFQAREALEPEAGAAYEPHGLRVDPTHHAVIHIPMAGGRIRLQATAWGEPSAAEAKPVLNLHWIGPGLGNRRTTKHAWTEEALDLEMPLPGGYLIAESNRPGYVRAWLKRPGEDLEITPPPDALMATRLDPGQEVSFQVPPPEGGPLAFRLDVRQIQDRPDPSTIRTWLYRDQISARWPFLAKTASPVRCEMLDGQGKVLQRIPLPVDPWLSPLEELPDSFRPARLGLPASTAFLLPAAVRRVRVVLERDPLAPPPPPLLVAGYNRPQTLPRLRVLPDDFYRYDTRETRLPEWFGLDPEGLESLIREKRWISLRTQHLPDAQEEGLLTGLYEVDPLEPLEGLLARELLVPRGLSNLLPREDGLPSYFREVRPGVETSVDLQARPGVETVRPALLRIGPPQAGPVEVAWDGRAHQRLAPASVIQETVLAPLPVGAHRFRLSPATGRYFLNRQWPGPGDWTKRLAYPCQPGQTLAFLHVRAGRQPESLTLGYFATGNPGGDVVLRLRLVGAGPAIGAPQASLTRMDRRFRVSLDGSRTAFLLMKEGSSLHAAPFASLSLGPDLPPGRYRVECTLESGPEGFLTLSRSQTGIRAKTLMDHESRLGGLP